MSAARIQGLINDLEVIREECLGNNKKEKSKKPADSFLSLKEDITLSLDEISKKVKERNEVIDKYGRTQQSIRLGMQIAKDIERCKETFNKLQRAFDKDQNRFLNKLTPEEIETRRKVINLLQSMIRDIDTVNANPRSNRPKGNNRIASQAKADLDEQKKKEDEEKRAKEKDRKRGGRGRRGDDEDTTKDTEMQPLSHDEEVFLQNAQVKDEQIDAKLDEVLRGVLILKDISMNIHEEIQVQNTMITDLDSKVTKTIDRFRFANNKMKELLEASGGAARWCPIIIAIIILVALAGYILSTAGVS